ncbi:MAG TPA: efflux RND transporter permease subunit [Gammaproteobacteria bacterium]|mgnify:CR=1 FL=1|nr:efflux RND transporter permease subunit [Gammaproteobacteria bacterium]
MILTRMALGNPVAALVVALVILLFGFISLTRLPVQLTPEVEHPAITITTSWRAAAPAEVESEILEPQERVLRGTPGMSSMLSRAQRGRGRLTLNFKVGTDFQRALVDVLNRLNRIGSYPEDAGEPRLSTIGARNRPVAWFVLKTLPGNKRKIGSYHHIVEELVQARLERVPGVALSDVRGGQAREVRITFDPYKMAALGIGIPAIAERVGENEDVSAGEADVGKRRYTIRFAGTYPIDQFGELVVDWREGRPVLLRDIATVELKPVERSSFVINQGEDAIAVNAYREAGVNVLKLMNDLQTAVKEIKGPLRQEGLSIEQVYDETLYIKQSIRMLATNLVAGILLAVVVLWWFMRRLRATAIVAAAIPLCLVFAFTIIDITGHTLNIISLAGLAFATGMVLDASIVVLENIVRLREQGKSLEQAALLGTNQVWGALLASTATTVAVFLPVVFLDDQVGQLFADLAIAIVAAVSASLLIAVYLVPAAASHWLAGLELEDKHAHWWRSASAWIMRVTDTPARRRGWILVLISVPLLLSGLLLPEADYLPTGNRNRVSASINVAPGVNLNTIEKEMGQVIARRMEPYLSGEKQPQIKHYFFVVYRGGAHMGVRPVDPDTVDELVPVLNDIISGFPDALAFARRDSLFRGLGGSGSVDVNLQSRHLEALLETARMGFDMIEEAIPGVSISPLPGLEMAEPEILLVPNERRIAEAGWNRETVARVARAFGSGLYVGEYFDGERRRDIVVRAEPWNTPEELEALPVVTPGAGVLPLSELVRVERTAGPAQIRRLDRRRTVTLQVRAPEGMSLEHLMKVLRTKVEPELLSLLPEDGGIRYSGSAKKLDEALSAVSGSFLLAIVILYLLMTALFRSFVDSLLVLVVLPLATVGGVASLQLVNLFSFQPLDLLTMIGFIILLGLVVNNAILLVYQTRSAEREGMGRRLAVQQAVQLRLRPILMSTLTSLFGMLPLLLVPGAGTELYRGLAAVIVGGLSVSTLFTLILLPSLLRLGETDSGSPAAGDTIAP